MMDMVDSCDGIVEARLARVGHTRHLASPEMETVRLGKS
jgi:hypothetical protein